MSKVFNKFTKQDIIFLSTYIWGAILFFILQQYVIEISAGWKLCVVLSFIASGIIYRQCKKKISFFNKKSLAVSALALTLLVSTSLIAYPTKNVEAKTIAVAASETRIPISTYYTASECRTIANRASTTSDWTTWAGLFIGFGKPIPGALIGLYGYSVSKTAQPFIIASNKGTGVRISYTYVIPSYTNIGWYENTTYSYY